ncbi:hypothetical protein Fmac_017170 [Flemingia macrophylla]|uniref:Uncharacterized protein n=1 Tax=Flemingia macrophylla TaxID=520843 RepID=A0ABD1M1E0_9FABA
MKSAFGTNSSFSLSLLESSEASASSTTPTLFPLLFEATPLALLERLVDVPTCPSPLPTCFLL